MSAAPPIAPERRRFAVRSPRPLSIGVAVVVLIVVYVGLQIGMPIYRQELAIREIERLGGRIGRRLGGPDWMRYLVGDEWMRLLRDEVTFVEID